LERTVAVVFPQAVFALCAASSAFSISSDVDLANSLKVNPVTGEGFSK